jgi:AcrR family transcriptional regulator
VASVPDNDDEDLFLPRSPLLGVQDRRERQIVAHVDRHRQHRGQPPRRVRGLSRADIVSTAIAIADAEGTDAVSMRRIAREMHAGAMSLYWYVSSKEELHKLMVHKVQAESEAPVPSGDWRADLRTYARNARAALLRHPWAIDFIGSGPPSGPNDARNVERLISAFDGLDLDIAMSMYIIITVGTYVLGAALREVQEIRWQEMAAGLSEAEVAELAGEFGRRIRQSGRYPHIVRLMDTDFDPDSPQTRDERFQFGLDCVLDGIAARLPA